MIVDIVSNKETISRVIVARINFADSLDNKTSSLAMKFNQLVSIVLGSMLAICLVSFVLAQQDEQGKIASPEVPSRANLAAPKILDFEQFKTSFKKRYASVVEELARKRIFLAKAFRAFLSWVGYKYFKHVKCLKISERSDWTRDEIKRSYRRHTLSDNLKAKLSIVQTREQVYKVLGATPAAREVHPVPKRSDRSQVSSDNLLDEDNQLTEVEEDLSSSRVKSNNPNYVSPELYSSAMEDHVLTTPKEFPESGFSTKMSSIPGSVLSSASEYLFNLKKTPDETELASELNFIEDIPLKAAMTRSKKKLADEVFVDHRDANCLVIPKSQGQCGSCYIFSTTAQYEWQYCQETGEKVAFSEQYALDCGERADLKGCQSGTEEEVAKFYGKFGIELRKKYPYREQSDICPYEPDTKEESMGYLKLDKSLEETGGLIGVSFKFLQDFLYKKPISIGIGVPDDFSDYGAGIDDGHGCVEDNGHSMVIVGSGREDGQEYWLLRNSYGHTWGEKGHYRLNKLAPLNCFWDDGLGYYLQGVGKDDHLFDHENERIGHDPEIVKKRADDVKRKRKIPHNPFTWIDPNSIKSGSVVTPPSIKT